MAREALGRLRAAEGYPPGLDSEFRELEQYLAAWRENYSGAVIVSTAIMAWLLVVIGWLTNATVISVFGFIIAVSLLFGARFLRTDLQFFDEKQINMAVEALVEKIKALPSIPTNELSCMSDFERCKLRSDSKLIACSTEFVVSISSQLVSIAHRVGERQE